MGIDEAINFIETSFLSPLLKNSSITDISFNGEEIYIQDNLKGRKKSLIKISDLQARDFIRQIANLTEKTFSYQSPILNVSIGRYRINAVHQSIGKKGENQVVTFSIRIGSPIIRINKETGFLDERLEALFKALLENKISILIGGVTGTGKTEFQKYLINQTKPNTRIIVIDNVLELDQVKYTNESDITFWQFDERETNISIQKLIKNALRCHPDWLIVAEARGEEMKEILSSAMSGHPIISTLHSLDIETMPNRVARLSMIGNNNTVYSDVFSDVAYHLRIYVFLSYKSDLNGINRYISSVGELLPNGKMNVIYSREKTKKIFGKLSKELIDKLTYQTGSLFEKTFIKGEI